MIILINHCQETQRSSECLLVWHSITWFYTQCLGSGTSLVTDIQHSSVVLAFHSLHVYNIVVRWYSITHVQTSQLGFGSNRNGDSRLAWTRLTRWKRSNWSHGHGSVTRTSQWSLTRSGAACKMPGTHAEQMGKHLFLIGMTVYIIYTSIRRFLSGFRRATW